MFSHICSQNSANDFLVSHGQTLVVGEMLIIPLLTRNEIKMVADSGVPLDNSELV